jgi:hypothetical protein
VLEHHGFRWTRPLDLPSYAFAVAKAILADVDQARSVELSAAAISDILVAVRATTKSTPP